MIQNFGTCKKSRFPQDEIKIIANVEIFNQDAKIVLNAIQPEVQMACQNPCHKMCQLPIAALTVCSATFGALKELPIQC